MEPRTVFRALWVLWAVTFAVIEATALVFFRGRGCSLSEQFWAAEKQTPIAWWIFAGALGWLTVHLLRVHGPWG